MPLGHSNDSEYGVYQTPITIPSSVKVGDGATVGTETLYTDSTKFTPAGTDVDSYVVEPDTAQTAIVNLITNSYQ